MEDEELSRLLRENATRHRAGEGLRAALRTQAALQAAARPAASLPRRRWTEAAFGFGAGVLLTAALALLLQRLPAAEPAAAEVVAGHVRALAAGALVEVASNDRHNVKPWFQGRVDFAPPVRDLAEAGFDLAGGRVQELGGHKAAVLVYRRHAHVVEVFVWAAAGEAPPQRGSERGFALLSAREGGLQLWAVGDVDAAEMDRFAAAWQAAAH